MCLFKISRYRRISAVCWDRCEKGLLWCPALLFVQVKRDLWAIRSVPCCRYLFVWAGKCRLYILGRSAIRWVVKFSVSCDVDWLGIAIRPTWPYRVIFIWYFSFQVELLLTFFIHRLGRNLSLLLLVVHYQLNLHKLFVYRYFFLSNRKGSFWDIFRLHLCFRGKWVVRLQIESILLQLCKRVWYLTNR